MENLVDDPTSEGLVTFPDDDTGDLQLDLVPVEAMQNQLQGVNGLGSSDTVKFEQKRTMNTSKSKIVTNGFSSEQVRRYQATIKSKLTTNRFRQRQTPPKSSHCKPATWSSRKPKVSPPYATEWKSTDWKRKKQTRFSRFVFFFALVFLFWFTPSRWRLSFTQSIKERRHRRAEVARESTENDFSLVGVENLPAKLIFSRVLTHFGMFSL